MLPEKGTGEVLSENPIRPKGDPSTIKGQDALRSLMLLLHVLTLLAREWELSIGTWVRLQPGLPSRSPRAVLLSP